MDFKDFKDLVSAYVDGEVTPEEKVSIELLLSTCKDSQKLLEDERKIKALVLKQSPRYRVDVELKSALYAVTSEPSAVPLSSGKSSTSLLQPIESSISSLPPGKTSLSPLPLGEGQGEGFLSWYRKLFPSLTFGRLAPVAAVLLVVLIGVFTLWKDASVYADGFLKDALFRHRAFCEGFKEMGIVSSDRQAVGSWFGDKLSYRVVVPKTNDENIVLLGGRLCMLDQSPVASIHYKINDVDLSLFETTPLNKELSRDLITRTVGGTRYWFFTENSCTTCYWEAGGYGFYLVGQFGIDEILTLAGHFIPDVPNPLEHICR